ncbi:PAP2 superfamily protein [Tritrichomonas foetus]|uniref:PAP2 superfamily protein n=1 Tax=Tritrichomonas foetus TaxID=1144522 RepID=A0A1J4K452_9EUKA|nr:PAP2 superfamily protein [Tritrichomonas foetus]|eukprot:OHT04532.1 PAP2 superfamily protein [Tritrichomonas foetus]
MVSAKEVFVDYHLIDIILLLILCVFWYILQNANPNRLYVPKRDPHCSYPHYDTGMKEATNLFVVVICPVIVYSILYGIIKTKGIMDGLIPFDYLFVIIGHIGCVILTNILGNILKLQVGRPRPDFFDVLGINANSETAQPDGMSNKQYIECFKSFPSGHTTSAACGMIYFILFLQKAIITHQFWIYFLKICPILYTFYIAAMRITEHRHHFEDVLAGLIIGLTFPIIFFSGATEYIFTQQPFP